MVVHRIFDLIGIYILRYWVVVCCESIARIVMVHWILLVSSIRPWLVLRRKHIVIKLHRRVGKPVLRIVLIGNLAVRHVDSCMRPLRRIVLDC